MSILGSAIVYIMTSIIRLMYFLKKNFRVDTFTEESIDCLPRLSERAKLSKLKDGRVFENDDSNTKQKQNVKTSRKLKTLRNQLSIDKHGNSFRFLQDNLNILNRTINNRAVKSLVHQYTVTKREVAIQKLSGMQIKLDKDEKKQWIALHKRTSTNVSRFNDGEDKKVYRSRQRYNQSTRDLFTARQEKTCCYEGVFPLSRLNSAMTVVTDKSTGKQRVFLVGGLSPEMGTKLQLHEYDAAEDVWKQSPSQQKYSPQFNLSQHVVVSYQKMIFVIGGIAVIPSSTEHKNQRYNIPFISYFNMRTGKWGRINWNVYLRAHAGAAIGNYAIIDGGVCEQEKVSNKTYLFDLTKTQCPLLMNSNSLGLSHHKIISTEVFEDKNKSFLKLEGLISFGGKNGEGVPSNTVYLMGYDGKQTDSIDRFGKFQWSKLETHGCPPQPRYMHSMDLIEMRPNIFQRKACCLVLGGIGANENVLNDMWLLDLLTLEWCQVQLAQQHCAILSKGIAGHSSAAARDQLLIFGGFDGNREHISKCWTISCESSFKSVRKQYKNAVVQP